jgi:tetratricopeptide (TPR) repeat protein
VLPAASAIVALAAWPAFVARTSVDDPVAAQTPAPLRDDARIRRETIAFLEPRAGRDPADQLLPRLLSAQYLQRYRERGDVGDLERARAAAERSLRAQPRRNVAGEAALASALLALHRFRDARDAYRRARHWTPDDPGIALGEASLDLELGDLAAATALVARNGDGRSPPSEVVKARIAELTGDLPLARTLLARASRRADAIYDLPAERRAWYHVRAGELAFEAGEVETALTEERTALARFADDAYALTDAARFSAALGRWRDVQAYAEHAVRVTPSPQNLGLLADAQEHLGDREGARATRDEIVAVERIGNAQRLVDRTLAMEYADHGVRLDVAYAMARRDRALRDDVYTEDALAWTAARSGRWDEARRAAARATAWNTADASIWYHAGVIAEHAGDRERARADYRRALALNPRFAAFFADDARTRADALSR